jgi:predicted ATPase/class 3 adenylate cyclase
MRSATPTGHGTHAGVFTFLYVDVGTAEESPEPAGLEHSATLSELLDLIRTEVNDREGSELETNQGAFAASFSSPSSALGAALGIQRSIASRSWPAGSVIRVRMGLHTGESDATTSASTTQDASRAQEIAAVCHAGQIVVSATTASLLDGFLPAGSRLDDLGVHRLRDLGHPQRLFQVEQEGLRSDFPPLRSLDNPVMLHNLPERLSSFVGRDGELAEIRQLVSSNRLVTLIGPGGVGKTRLALQVGAELLDGEGDGVWLIELAGVSEPEQVATTVAGALTIQPASGRSIRESLIECLRNQRMLLVLDNCEHLIESVATLCDAFLSSCPGLHVLATSREPLGVYGETVYRLPPLSLPPDDDADPRDFDAIRLFEQRARSNQPAFVLDATNRGLVVSLCARLDGIPLALELAAARLRSASLQQIYDHLDDRFRLLTGGSRSALPRQQTLFATVEWSYGLLDRDEQRLLKQLSAFAGDFLLETAESLCRQLGDETFSVMDGLGSLVDKSLVVFDPAPSCARYRLLETIRQFASGKVQSDDGADARRALLDAHADVFLDVVERAGENLRAGNQLEWLERLESEHDNLRAAIGHLLADSAATEKAMRMAQSLKWFWQIRGHRVEALEVFEQLATRPESTEPTLLATQILNQGGEFLLGVDAGRAQTCLEKALAMAQRLGEGGAAAVSLSLLASLADQRGDAEMESRLRLEAIDLARAKGDPVILGDVLSAPTHAPDDLAPLEEAMGCFASSGDRIGRYMALLNLGAISLGQSGPGVARAHLEAAMELGRALGVGKDHTLMINIAEACVLEGEFGRANELYADAVRVARRHADSRAVQYGVLGLALCASAGGQNELAAKLHGLADANLKALGYVWAPENLALAEVDRSHLRDVMGEEEFSSQYTAGGSWDVADAMSAVHNQLAES